MKIAVFGCGFVDNPQTFLEKTGTDIIRVDQYYIRTRSQQAILDASVLLYVPSSDEGW